MHEFTGGDIAIPLVLLQVVEKRGHLSILNQIIPMRKPSVS